VPKTSSKCLPDIRENLESDLERLLECSSQRLSKLEEMIPGVFESSERHWASS
jgi:hypothetical protein